MADGTIEAVLNIVEYQVTDPDPVDQDDFPEESNPYGLTVMPNGDALVADAAANDIIRVTPAGVATTVARFDLEVHLDTRTSRGSLIPGDRRPRPCRRRSIVGPDGAIYVGRAEGLPVQRRARRHVWRIEPDADGASCSVNTPER